jgi:NAD(P)-dependent dehydrogenase (short-subunit alcohol dehydrogenase family)
MNPAQHPIPSGFNRDSTADQIMAGVDMTGKTAIVTGGYAGIGLETVRVLIKAGATVIVGARDMDKARKNLAAIPGVQIRPLDLLDPKSIDAFASSFVDAGGPLHLLINNAGVMANPLKRDARGYESQFATNHLGHFQLTARLWLLLVATGGSRVINVSSRGHRFSPVVFEDPNFDHREYDKWKAYGQSKTANVLFSVELDRLGQNRGVRSFGLHPGAIFDTDLGRHLTDDDLKAFGITRENGKADFDPSKVPFHMKTIEQGAASTVWCATSPQLNNLGGVYCEDCDISVRTAAEDLTADGVRDWAIDPDAAKRLWALSEKLTGVTFNVT